MGLSHGAESGEVQSQELQSASLQSCASPSWGLNHADLCQITMTFSMIVPGFLSKHLLN